MDSRRPLKQGIHYISSDVKEDSRTHCISSVLKEDSKQVQHYISSDLNGFQTSNKLCII